MCIHDYKTEVLFKCIVQSVRKITNGSLDLMNSYEYL